MRKEKARQLRMMKDAFLCMFFEDDGFERNIEENESNADEETIEVLEKVENYTRVRKIYIFIYFYFF